MQTISNENAARLISNEIAIKNLLNNVETHIITLRCQLLSYDIYSPYLKDEKKQKSVEEERFKIHKDIYDLVFFSDFYKGLLKLQHTKIAINNKKTIVNNGINSLSQIALYFHNK